MRRCVRRATSVSPSRSCTTPAPRHRCPSEAWTCRLRRSTRRSSARSRRATRASLTPRRWLADRPRGQMAHAAPLAALGLAAATGHRPRGTLGALILVVVTGVVVYYFWRRRKASERDRDERR